MRLAAIGATDVGRKRRHNEDAFLVMPEAGLFAVADGLGGHVSGEVASRMAVDELAGHFVGLAGTPEERLREAFRLANRAIHGLSLADPRLSGMGTTLVAGHFSEGGTLTVAHVGDSRAYHFRARRAAPAHRGPLPAPGLHPPVPPDARPRSRPSRTRT